MISAVALEAVTQSELSRAASVFGTLKQLRVKLKNVDEGVLDRAFEVHVQRVLDKLESRLPSLTDSKLRDVEITMAKHGLYDAAFQQVIILCQGISPALGDSLKDLRSIHSGFMTNLQQSASDFVTEIDGLHGIISTNNNYIRQLEGDIARLQETMERLDEEAQGQQKKILELRHHLREAAHEITHLREVGGNAAKQIAQSQGFHFDASAAPVFGTDPSLNKSLNRSASNISMLSSAPNSPHYASRLKKNEPPRSVFNFDAVVQQQEDGYMGGGGGGDARSVLSSGGRSGVASRAPTAAGGAGGGGGMNTPAKGPLSIVAPVNWLHQFRQDVQKAIDDGRCREITLKECKETIERIYDSKTVANEKALQGIGNLPMETIEQHTYRSMEKKYGLRNLAVEHVGMLLRALERYCDEDNEVSVFQKIFRNEIEEDFRLIQMELVKSIRELTMVQTMNKFPTKDQATLQNMVEQRLATGSINENEWKDMVEYLYNTTDSMAICVILKRQALDMMDVSVDDAMQLSASLQQQQQQQIPLGAKTFTIGTTGTQSNLNAENGGILPYDKNNRNDNKRLGYTSPTLKIHMKAATPKSAKRELLRLPCSVFIKTILDFQLRSHQLYLRQFLQVFRQLDTDVDGVLTAMEFKDCFLLMRKSYMTGIQFDDNVSLSSSFRNSAQEDSELTNTFVTLIKQLDPMETDRIIYSSAVTCLNKLHPGGGN